MVERCADCGFDLAGGLVEVVPTAHYMMGGVEFARRLHAPRCPGLFVAGEDSGGVHGANRLGGNGVANSTVFGAVAGDAMAAWVRTASAAASPTGPRSTPRSRLASGLSDSGPRSDLEPLRERLYDVMWDKVGILRDAAGLQEAQADLQRAGSRRWTRYAVPSAERAFNLTWHDWLNLKSLVAVSRAIAAAAAARRDSRGAHFRADFPESGPLEQSAFTSIKDVHRLDEAGRIHPRRARPEPATQCGLTQIHRELSPRPACGSSATCPTPATSA